jgi:hypothetical protein
LDVVRREENPLLLRGKKRKKRELIVMFLKYEADNHDVMILLINEVLKLATIQGKFGCSITLI